MAKFIRYALEHLFHNQNKKYTYHRLLANYKAGLGDRLDIPGSIKVVFGDYCGVLLLPQVLSE